MKELTRSVCLAGGVQVTSSCRLRRKSVGGGNVAETPNVSRQQHVLTPGQLNEFNPSPGQNRTQIMVIELCYQFKAPKSISYKHE